VQTVFHKTTNLPKTARGWWQLAVSLNKARGITVLNPTPFFDVDALAVRAADAAKYHLVTVADMKKVPSASIGARPEFKLVFGVQPVAPEVSNKLLTALGSQAARFKSTMNAVSAKLTQKAILAMNSAVVNNKQTPKAVASAFLKANGLG